METIDPKAKKLLEAISKSTNKFCAELSKSILSGDVTIEQQKPFAGSFMRAVMEGDADTAIDRADADNTLAIIQNARELWNDYKSKNR